MLVYWEGRFNWRFVKHAPDALLFFLRKLKLSEQIIDELTICITNKDENGKILSGQDEAGYTEVLDGGEKKQPRKFIIGISLHSKSANEKLSTLAHEATHVKQYAVGHLDHLGHNTIWRGKVWKNKVKDETDTYFDSPWEIEAYGMERGLVYRYVEYLKNTKAFYGEDDTFDCEKLQKYM
jgi:hypothetical protein